MQQNPVDREKTCPFLMRCFWKSNSGFSAQDYNSPILPPNELQLYTWSDASLREIATQIKEAIPIDLQPTAYIAFSLVYPDKNGYLKIKPIGRVQSSRPGPQDNMFLSEFKFEIGDYLDVARGLQQLGMLA
eukprot:gene4162-8277_t